MCGDATGAAPALWAGGARLASSAPSKPFGSGSLASRVLRRSSKRSCGQGCSTYLPEGGSRWVGWLETTC